MRRIDEIPRHGPIDHGQIAQDDGLRCGEAGNSGGDARTTIVRQTARKDLIELFFC